MLILYGTEGCHLCHDAQALLTQMGLVWQDHEIVDDDHLLERYGTRIPVLSHRGIELDWPFGADQIRRLLSTTD
jgi:glutaredoxin